MHLDIIKSMTGHSLADHLHDWHYEAMAWLEEQGVPVIFTEDLKYVNRAWYSLRYINKCGDPNPIRELALCFDIFGGPRGTWQELTQEIQTLRGDS